MSGSNDSLSFSGGDVSRGNCVVDEMDILWGVLYLKRYKWSNMVATESDYCESDMHSSRVLMRVVMTGRWCIVDRC